MSEETGRGEPLSSVDAAWLRMDGPANRMVVVGVLVLERPVRYHDLRARLEQTLLRFPRFRRKVVVSAGRMAGPRWEDDPSFDPARHVVREDLPPPGGEAALQARVSDLLSEPLDRAHPLWRFHLVEKYEGGSALVCRIHHCIADGIALVRVMLSMADGGAEPQRGAGSSGGDGEPGSLGRSVGRAVGRTLNAASEIVGEPLRTAGRVSSSATGLARLLLLSPDSPTAFRGEPGVAKRASWSRPLALDLVKAAARGTGSTVNDVLLATLSGALGGYLRRRDPSVTPPDIRAVVPVNLRRPEEAHELGNRFGLVFAELPLGVEDVLERIFEVRRRMGRLKDSAESYLSFQILRTMGAAPEAVFRGLERSFGRKATLVVTNVAGPREPLSIAGSPLRQAMFWVPRAGGLGLGASILSYAGRVWLGLATDAGLVPDPEVILERFHAEFDRTVDLLRQAGNV